jgi:hypothetical protein
MKLRDLLAADLAKPSCDAAIIAHSTALISVSQQLINVADTLVAASGRRILRRSA